MTVEIDWSEKNVLAIEEYKKLIREQYEEPIDGKFPDATKAILDELKSPSDYEELDFDTDEEEL